MRKKHFLSIDLIQNSLTGVAFETINELHQNEVLL